MRDKVITKCVLDMETLEWTSVESFPYNGQWDLCLGEAISAGASIVGGLLGGGGASKAAKQMSQEEQDFYQSLTNEQNTQFQNEQQAQQEIQKMNAPIVSGGAYQYGFSTAEDQQLQKNIEEAGATATENTVAAEQLRQQQATGGAPGAMPTGAQTALESQVRETGAQATAAQLGQEKELGYQTGRELYQQAVQTEENVAQLASPTSYAGAATSAGAGAQQAISTVDTENAQSSTAKMLGGLLGGAGVQSLISKIPGGGGTPSVGNLPTSTLPFNPTSIPNLQG
jgi:hypothetical protein